jgi:hypothetical protein
MANPLISPTGPFYATAVSAGADWTTPSNATGVEDGSTADNFNQGPGGGGHAPSGFTTSGHGFAIPAYGIIDGIKLEAKVYGDGDTGSSDTLIKVGTSTKLSTSSPNFGQFWPNPLAFLTWGSATSLWGRTDWTPADINDSSFGATLAAEASHATGTISIDAVRITVYWHLGPTDVPKRYLYKVFSNSEYLGNLPNVVSEFAFSQDINTAGAQISIECAVSADTSNQPTDPLTDEAGNILTDESSVNLTSEGALPIVATGNSTTNVLIRNGNNLQVWEYSYYYPNGKCMFLGEMERWEASFGGDGGDTIKIMAYSDGQDLDNYLVRGNPYTYTLDVAQNSQNAAITVDTAGMGAAFDKVGQVWKIGAGVTNLGALSFLMQGTANVTVNIYDDPATMRLIASVTQYQSWAAPQEVVYALPAIVTVPGTTRFFTISVDPGQSINVYYQNTDVYANGSMYIANYGGGGGGGFAGTSYDLFFKTYSGTGATIGTFTAQDPTTGMVATFMNDYISRGGSISYTSGDSVRATGLSLTYTFNTNTIYEGIKAALTLSPDGFYYYVDLGTDVLYFKQANTVADIVLTKGRHIEKLTLTASIEGVKNQIFFTGGATAGVNLYKQYQDPTSVGLYGTRMDRKVDNRVTVAATADAIGGSALSELKNENYQSTVTVVDKTMDTTLLKPGLVIGFNGFGTFVDNVLAQIVRVDYGPSEATLTLGILPKRIIPEFEKITRGLIAEQTIANPTSPS